MSCSQPIDGQNGLRIKLRAGFACWCIASLASGLVAETSKKPKDLSELAVQRWDVDSGLASNSIRDIIQDQRGFVWIATKRSLTRFDGHDFVNYQPSNTPELPEGPPTSLVTGSSGRIWVGFEQGGVRAIEDGSIIQPPEVAALQNLQVNDLIEDIDGTLWVATEGGLWRSSPTGGERVRPVSDIGKGARELGGLRVGGLVRGNNGDLWARTDEPSLWRIRSGEVDQTFELPDCWGPEVQVAANGEMLVACANELLAVHPESGQRRSFLHEPVVAGLFVDGSGDVWFASRRGLARRSQSSTQSIATIQWLALDQSLRDWRVLATFEDKDGGLWFGTNSGGLVHFRRGAVRMVSAPDGISIEAATAVLGLHDGSLLVGSYRNGAIRWHPDKGVLHHWSTSNGLPSDTVWTFAVDPDEPERLWIGTARGLVVADANGVHRVGPLGLSFDDAAYIVYLDPRASGTLWVAGWEGELIEVRGDQYQLHSTDNGLPASRIRFLHRDRSGRLLVGSDDGLFRLDDSEWLPVELANRSVPNLMAIFEQDDGTIWLSSTSDGLLRFTSAGLDAYGQRQGLPVHRFYNFLEDDAGDMWLSADEGIFQFDPDDYEAWSRGRLESVPFERLTTRDGLHATESNGWGRPNVSQLPDGSLAYPTMKGLALVKKSELPTVDLGSADIVVDMAWTGQRPLPQGSNWHLSEEERSLRIRYSAIEHVRPEAVTFRHQLVGVDESWVPGTSTREANYSPLPPGRFPFRVQARLPGQEWVQSDVVPVVVVDPRLTETVWFRTLSALLVILLLIVLYRWRGRVKRRYTVQLERHQVELRESHAEARELSLKVLKAQEEERRRLGREIHDDLTQRLAGLAMLAGSSAQSKTTEGPEIRKSLHDLGLQLEKLAEDAQGLSRDLHPTILDHYGLEEALRSECATFSENTGLDVTFDCQSVSASLDPEIELALYRISQESLRNAHSHAEASKIHVTLTRDNGSVELRVEDSGAGFDTAVARRKPGVGLASMAERARLAGGVLSVQSAPGRGTVVEVRVPIPEP